MRISFVAMILSSLLDGPKQRQAVFKGFGYRWLVAGTVWLWVGRTSTTRATAPVVPA